MTGTGRRRLLFALIATVLVASASIVGTESSYVSSQNSSQQVGTAPLIQVGPGTPAATSPQTYSISGLAPGSYSDQLVNLRNDGTPTTPAIEIALTSATNTSLDTDATNGLRVAIDLCSVAWQQSAPGLPAACAGTTTVVFAATALATAKAASPSAQLTAGLASLTNPGVDHLRARFALPAAAPVGYSALTSKPTLTVWGASGPASPTTVTAGAGDGQLTATWNASAGGYGLAVSGYTATATPGGGTCTTTSALTCVISGLTDGITYTVKVSATNSAATGSASSGASAIPFPALIIGTGHVLWLDGADLTTLFQDTAGTNPVTTAGQYIARWKDKSGSNNDVLAPGTPSTTAPTADTATFGGKVAPTFSASRYLTLATGFPTASDYSVLATYEATTNGGACHNNIIAGTSGTGHVFYTNSGGGLTLYHSAPFATTTLGKTVNVAYIGSGTFVNTSKLGSVDVNAAPAVTGTASTNNPTDAGIQIGAHQSSNGFCGMIPEVMAFSRALSTAERRTLQEYMARKWSIAITAQAPTAAAASVASTTSATVSWSVPAWDGGASVTGYTVTSSPGGLTCSAATTSCTVTGLTHSTPYTFTVTATNSAGVGAASSPSGSVTP
ncbi:fibronectin type III domain protein [Jatrophihabitans sp. GAS493]|uniref:fibronectin type III domain-containing protein n=1 Tax=Jatrophihabitans sp. GAS493 TaxID=1907575 RepID=UPI000BB7DD9A|nr:fibronectin type III domain-containing protein [Jatrophihabitans sp. GAS493]SOD71075.1 fibronectin type III domain protein [Jatrophihabitans sp. GAS493]